MHQTKLFFLFSIVKCESLCQVNFSVVTFDVTNLLCDDSNSKNWDCALDELENELADTELRLDKQFSLKYFVQSPPKMQIFKFRSTALIKKNLFIFSLILGLVDQVMKRIL